jgi:sulfate transporter 1, high-affinity
VQWNWQTVAIAFTFLAFLLLAKYIVGVSFYFYFFSSRRLCFVFYNLVMVFSFLSYAQGKRNKKYFWVPAIAPVTSVILATLFVYLFRADKQGVQIVSSTQVREERRP